MLGVQPPEAAATATFIQNIDELFYDSNNNPAFLDTMEIWLNPWKVITNHNNFPFINGWILNINSLKCLRQDVKDNHEFEFLLTN